MRVRSLLLVAALAAGCKHRASIADREVDEGDEASETRDNVWRAQIAITGRGRVRTVAETFDCSSDGTRTSGACGPTLVRFDELAPPLLHATGAPGWHFDHWASQIRARDGSVHPRAGAMPDGALYLDGFGYADTGELETVTAVFVRD